MSTFVGYASTTEQPYDMGYYLETVGRNAFKKTLSENPDVFLNLAHADAGSGLPIARTGENMTLSEDLTGLLVSAELDDGDPDVQLLVRKAEAHLIDQMSFSFRITRQSWDPDYTERRIQEVDLHGGDVTVTPTGANPHTSFSLRSRAALTQLRAPGRPAAVQRRKLAEQLGQAAVVEFRSFKFNGVEYDFTGTVTERLRAARGGQSPVVLPDHTTPARLALARASAPRASKQPVPVHEMVVADIRAGRLSDPVAVARRQLAACAHRDSA